MMGVNRSATIVAAWLMETNRWTAAEALCYLEERRPVVNPVSRHVRQLEAFQELLGIPNGGGGARGRPGKGPAAWGRRQLQLWTLVCLLAGLACWSMADRGLLRHGKGPAGMPAGCRVIASGVQRLGGCDGCGAGGNYTACSPFTWCADEGGTCNCRGTVRYTARGTGARAAEAAEHRAEGRVRCAGADFGRQPAAEEPGECLCRPAGVEGIAPAAPTHAACGWEGAAGPPRTAGAACGRAYLPWALVVLDGSNASGEVHCAYQHGVPALSVLDSPERAADALAELQPGRVLPCHVAAGERGNHSLVALAHLDSSGGAEALKKAGERFYLSWFFVGLGFLLAGAPAARHLLAPPGEAREEARREGHLVGAQGVARPLLLDC